MSLPDVQGGDPHVNAHNNERHAINDILDLSDPDLLDALALWLKPNEKNRSVALQAATEYLAKVQIVNDGSDSSVWPNRLEFEFKPNAANTIGQHLTGWFNEYGEFRCTPAKANTVAFRVFSKELSTDADHDGDVPVFEMVYSRNIRTPIFGVMANGTVYTTGPIERRVPSGPTLSAGILILGPADPVPANTPANTLIARTA